LGHCIFAVFSASQPSCCSSTSRASFACPVTEACSRRRLGGTMPPATRVRFLFPCTRGREHAEAHARTGTLPMGSKKTNQPFHLGPFPPTPTPPSRPLPPPCPPPRPSIPLLPFSRSRPIPSARLLMPTGKRKTKVKTAHRRCMALEARMQTLARPARRVQGSTAVCGPHRI